VKQLKTHRMEGSTSTIIILIFNLIIKINLKKENLH